MKKQQSTRPPLYIIIFLLSYSTIGAQEKTETLNNNTGIPSNNFYTSQYKPHEAIDGFGYYKLYNNSFNYEAEKVRITLGAGLVEQNTIFNNAAPAFSGSLNSYLEYKFTNKLSFYLFGQYLTPSFNEEISLQEVFMHPLFPQTEIGTGLKGNFNNVEVDVGTRAIFNSQLNPSGPSTLINTKVSVGF